tara:strand:+ start:120 stop:386 length:267 start_codon:yes stop_codon:yes gene_type:complete
MKMKVKMPLKKPKKHVKKPLPKPQIMKDNEEMMDYIVKSVKKNLKRSDIRDRLKQSKKTGGTGVSFTKQSLGFFPMKHSSKKKTKKGK